MQTPLSLTVPEGESGTYTVELSSQPTAAVTVALTASAGLTVEPESLTFAARGWSAAQTVTVTALHDADAVDGSATVSPAVTGGDYENLAAADVTVTVDDDETQGVVLAPETLTVAEGGAATWTVKLSSEPTGNVTVAIDGTAGSDLSLDRSSVTFTAQNWQKERTVEVSAAHDSDASPDTARLAHTASGADYVSVSRTLTVTVTDDDAPALVLSQAALTVTEGASAEYTVELDTRPTGDVTVAIGGTADTDLSVEPAVLTFTTGNWGEAQTVTATGGHDADAVADGEVTLTHTADGADYASVSKNLVVTLAEDDEAGLALSHETLAVTEGASATYTVALDTLPTAEVTVAIGGTADTDLSVDPVVLTFTSGDWEEVQTVTVVADPDADAVADRATLTHEAGGGDYGSVSRKLTVSVTDTDSAGLVLSETALTVGEGASATYTVELATAPTAEVTVTIGGTADTDLSVEPAVLTYTTGDWGTVQTVTVSAGRDADAADDRATLTHTAAGGDYQSMSKALTVTVADPETAAIVLSEAVLAVPEGAGASYTVKLGSEPTGEVTVTIGGTTGTDLSVTPETADVHGPDLADGADGGGGGRRRRRRGAGQRHADPRGGRRGLRFGCPQPAGDGDGERSGRDRLYARLADGE